MTKQVTPEWIALDWGTSNLRAYAMQGAVAVAKAASSDGMARLVQDAFEEAMLELISPWLTDGAVPVIACGMVGSRQGWVEAPYRSVPCTPLGETLTTAPVTGSLSVQVIAGLSQANPADVMRGEETQIAGFLSLNPGWDGILCLPGTHTKWAQLSAGEVVSFQTFMTGEMFELMCTSSVLRHSVAQDGWDESVFKTAVADTLSRPERLTGRLFGLRASDLLEGTAGNANRAALSGYLIGAELSAARPYWLGQNIAILGTGTQARAYVSALESQGAPAMLVDAERATLAGLTAAWRTQKETT